MKVSIQLISPASGNCSKIEYPTSLILCFHSINIPSEWESQIKFARVKYDLGFHSINIPSEWEFGFKKTLADDKFPFN